AAGAEAARQHSVRPASVLIAAEIVAPDTAVLLAVVRPEPDVPVVDLVDVGARDRGEDPLAPPAVRALADRSRPRRPGVRAVPPRGHIAARVRAPRPALAVPHVAPVTDERIDEDRIFEIGIAMRDVDDQVVRGRAKRVRNSDR